MIAHMGGHNGRVEKEGFVEYFQERLQWSPSKFDETIEQFMDAAVLARKERRRVEGRELVHPKSPEQASVRRAWIDRASLINDTDKEIQKQHKEVYAVRAELHHQLGEVTTLHGPTTSWIIMKPPHAFRDIGNVF